MTHEFQHHEYQVKKEIAETILREGGHIFGGYVRDKLLHDSHAQKFYKKHGAESATLYSDKTSSPELSGRFVCPNDIDCYMKKTCMESIIEKLIEANMNVKQHFDRDPVSYLPNLNIPVGSMRHYRLGVSVFHQNIIREISFAVHDCLHSSVSRLLGRQITNFLESLHSEHGQGLRKQYAPIYIDIFCPVNEEDFDTYEAPFSNLDFECNGLIYTAQGIRLSKSIFSEGEPSPVEMPLNTFQRLAKIIDDIDNRVATVVNLQVSIRRIRKMIHKDWNISGKEFIVVDTRNVATDDLRHCLICHENFLPTNPAYKMPCCNASFHLGCLIKSCNEGVSAMVVTKKCVMCRKDVNIIDEIPFLECVSDLKSVYNTFIVERRPRHTLQQEDIAVAPPRQRRIIAVRQRARVFPFQVEMALAIPIPLPVPIPLPTQHNDDRRGY